MGQCQTSTQAQPFSISVLPKTGVLLSHRPTMSHLIKKRNTAVELSFTKQDNTESYWSTNYRFPSRGVSFMFQDFGNSEVLGTSVSVFRFTKFPIFQSEKWGFLDFRLGNGVSYITKKYNSFTNKKNIAIGSHINGFVNFCFLYTKHFGRFYTGVGFDFSHFSNASLKMPNQGLNTVTGFFVVGMALKKREVFGQQALKDSVFSATKPLTHKWHFHFITGLKQNLPDFKPSRTFGLVALQAFRNKQLTNKWAVEFGIDLIYNEANRWLNSFKPKPVLGNIQLGGYFGGCVTIYDTQIYGGLGLYGLNLYDPAGWVYNRIGARWLVNEQWDLLLGIKAHFGIADYLEWGIGYRL